MKSHEVNFQKSTETARLSGWEFKADNIPYWHLCNSPLKFNEYLLNVLNRSPPWSSLGEHFL